MTVVHGACPTGADAIADAWARRQGIERERHPADWSAGPSAGPARNSAMVAAGADVCLAFARPDSRGTRDAATKAQAAGIPLQVWSANTPRTPSTARRMAADACRDLPQRERPPERGRATSSRTPPTP